MKKFLIPVAVVAVAAVAAYAADNPVQVYPTGATSATPSILRNTTLGADVIVKASAGDLYSVYVTTSTDSGYLMTFDSTTDPADGAVTPIDCVVAPAYSTTTISYGDMSEYHYSTGIVAVFSTTGCFTKTEDATAFFMARYK